MMAWRWHDGMEVVLHSDKQSVMVWHTVLKCVCICGAMCVCMWTCVSVRRVCVCVCVHAVQCVCVCVSSQSEATHADWLRALLP